MFNLRTWRFDDSLEAPSGKFTLPFRSSFSPPPRAFYFLLTPPSLSPAEACSQTIHFSEGTNGERMMILQRRGDLRGDELRNLSERLLHECKMLEVLMRCEEEFAEVELHENTSENGGGPHGISNCASSLIMGLLYANLQNM